MNDSRLALKYGENKLLGVDSVTPEMFDSIRDAVLVEWAKEKMAFDAKKKNVFPEVSDHVWVKKMMMHGCLTTFSSSKGILMEEKKTVVGLGNHLQQRQSELGW